MMPPCQLPRAPFSRCRSLENHPSPTALRCPDLRANPPHHPAKRGAPRLARTQQPCASCAGHHCVSGLSVSAAKRRPLSRVARSSSPLLLNAAGNEVINNFDRHLLVRPRARARVAAVLPPIFSSTSPATTSPKWRHVAPPLPRARRRIATTSGNAANAHGPGHERGLADVRAATVGGVADARARVRFRGPRARRETGAHEQVAVQVPAAGLRPEQGSAWARARARVLPRPSRELSRDVGLPRHARGVQLPPVLLAPRREGAAGAVPAVAAALQLHGLHAHPGRVQLLFARRAGYQRSWPRGNGPSAALRGAQTSARLFFPELLAAAREGWGKVGRAPLRVPARRASRGRGER